MLFYTLARDDKWYKIYGKKLLFINRHDLEVHSIYHPISCQIVEVSLRLTDIEPEHSDAEVCLNIDDDDKPGTVLPWWNFIKSQRK